MEVEGLHSPVRGPRTTEPGLMDWTYVVHVVGRVEEQGIVIRLSTPGCSGRDGENCLGRLTLNLAI